MLFLVSLDVDCIAVSTREFTCGPCPRGSVGDGFSCSASPCSSSPCFAGVACLELETRGYICGSCPPGFSGDGSRCEKEGEQENLKPVDNEVGDPCSPNPCYPGVLCMTVWKGMEATFSCGLCPDGKLNQHNIDIYDKQY